MTPGKQLSDGIRGLGRVRLYASTNVVTPLCSKARGFDLGDKDVVAGV